MPVELRRIAADEAAILTPLVDAYLAELAGHRERPVGATCAADHPYLPLYWSEAGRHPFAIFSDAALAGFVLVREVALGTEADGPRATQMSEFYVRPAFRRRGVGRAALAVVWRRFPGAWELQVHPRNAAAAAFWPACIGAHAHGPVRAIDVEEADGRRVQYEFEIPPPAPER